MIGAGIFALTGQVAEYAGSLFPLAFIVAAIISGFSAYSYIKVSNKYPSAGGIAMILKKAYGPVTVTGAAALLMAFSMIINESLVARTFGTYTLQLFDVDDDTIWVPLLAVSLIVFAFVVNISGNKLIGNLSKVTAILKVGGIMVFALVALWASGFAFKPATGGIGEQASTGGFLAGVALAILAYKGFTTITNSGGEVENPEKNVGRAIIASLAICVARASGVRAGWCTCASPSWPRTGCCSRQDWSNWAAWPRHSATSSSSRSSPFRSAPRTGACCWIRGRKRAFRVHAASWIGSASRWTGRATSSAGFRAMPG